MAAPASAASTAASAISCGVTGSAFDIEGVWIAPVTAQVMMTLRGAMVFCLFVEEVESGFIDLLDLVGGERGNAFVASRGQRRDALGFRRIGPGRDHRIDIG